MPGQLAPVPMTELSEQQHTLSCLLLPLAAGNLLLPNAAVVEVSAYPAAIEPVEHAPDWYAGRFRWRGLSLPLVEWERLMGQSATVDPDRRKSLAICHLFSADAAALCMGLEISGLPRLLALTQAGLQTQVDSAVPESCILGAVRLQDTVAWIPDLDALGRMIVSFA